MPRSYLIYVSGQSGLLQKIQVSTPYLIDLQTGAIGAELDVQKELWSKEVDSGSSRLPLLRKLRTKKDIAQHKTIIGHRLLPNNRLTQSHLLFFFSPLAGEE